MPQLEVDAVVKNFRGLRAVGGVSLRVADAQIVGLIGPNGAGKTTLFHAIAGAVAIDSGEVRYDGKRVSGLRPDQICRAGISRTFQIMRPFAGLSVLDNVIVGALARERSLVEARRQSLALLEQLGLGPRAHIPAASLTLPERKRLEVARALATRPRLLLLDEVMAGLRPTETDQMVSTFLQINREQGIAILLIEHVMRAVMALASEIVVLHHGEVLTHGAPAEVVRSPQVLEVYLGTESDV